MTAQFSEKLKYKNETHQMYTEPLGLYISQNKLHFPSASTANWRGYLGDWAIMGNDQTGYRLYLVGISANDFDGRRIQLPDLFPQSPKSVFAHWFSGVIRCPQGERLKYVHMGYASVYERDMFLEFEKGVLVNERIVTNDPPPIIEYEEKDIPWYLRPGGKKDE